MSRAINIIFPFFSTDTCTFNPPGISDHCGSLPRGPGSVHLCSPQPSRTGHHLSLPQGRGCSSASRGDSAEDRGVAHPGKSLFNSSFYVINVKKDLNKREFPLH